MNQIKSCTTCKNNQSKQFNKIIPSNKPNLNNKIISSNQNRNQNLNQSTNRYDLKNKLISQVSQQPQVQLQRSTLIKSSVKSTIIRPTQSLITFATTDTATTPGLCGDYFTYNGYIDQPIQNYCTSMGIAGYPVDGTKAYYLHHHRLCVHCLGDQYSSASTP